MGLVFSEDKYFPEILIAMGTCPIVQLAGLRNAFVGANPGQEIEIKILRDGTENTVSAVSEAIIFADVDIKRGPNVHDNRCDACCDCTIPRANTGCQTVWKFRDNGHNGGYTL